VAEAPPRAVEPGALETVLRERRAAGSKLLIPYVMAGMTEDWVLVLEAVAAAGADAIELGLPFSDPMIDGPVIQAAGRAALERGTTVHAALEGVAAADLGVPVLVMTYYNLVFRTGHRRFAAALEGCGIGGALVVDLSLEEIGPWAAAADAAGIATVLMVAPSTPPARAMALGARARGFVYAAARMGVTGERAELGPAVAEVVARARAASDLPVCAGIGISTPEQARSVCELADGVAVGSALVRRLLEGGGPDAAAAFVGELRAALGP
jgi:tryptophan synthase alpha chain